MRVLRPSRVVRARFSIPWLRAGLFACAATGLMLSLPACSTNDPTGPELRAISGPVVLKGYFTASDGHFTGTRVVGDADGVRVELVHGDRVIATTTTVDGTYRFSGLGVGTYYARTLRVGAIYDTTEALTVAVANVVVADTLRMNSQGDLYPVPNPFADSTRIYFEVPEAVTVQITIRDLAGHPVRVLRTGEISPGLRGLVWDGRNDDGAPVSAPIHWVEYVSGDDRRAHLLFR